MAKNNPTRKEFPETPSSDHHSGEFPGANDRNASDRETASKQTDSLRQDGPSSRFKPEDAPDNREKIPFPQRNSGAAAGPSEPGPSARLELYREPSRALLALALAGIVIGTIGSILLIGHPQARYLGIGMAFFAGGLAVWRLFVDDKIHDADTISARDMVIRQLTNRCEELEDRAWELKESDERQASILSNLGDIVLRRDPENRIVYANKAAQTAFGDAPGFAAGDVFGLPRLPTHADRIAGNSTQEPSKTLGEDNRFGFGDILLQTNKGPRWYSRVDINVRDTTSGKPLRQTVLRDVTERRTIEEELLAARHSAESSNEAKSRFLATVSHEIRTPLNGILGMATLLRDTRLTKEQIAYIEALETSGETLLLLIDEVLDFSKVEAGKLEIDATPTSLAALAENVVELLSPKAQGKGLEIGTYIAPHLPDTVTVDATRVRQILFNLTGNGVKFTDAGGVFISVDGQAAEDGGTLLQIEVRDTGIGFNEAEAKRLFKEFEQLDHGMARKFGGTGLGLAIAQRQAKLMGGAITATPGDDRGAIFRVTLPVPEALLDQAPKPLDGRRVALVGNGSIELPLLARRLMADGAAVHLVTPGDAGQDDHLARADLVVADHSSLSDAAGWLAAARLAGCEAPAVILVSPPERDRLERLREAGYGAYLIRPVRMESLSTVVEGLLEENGNAVCWDVISEPDSLPHRHKTSATPFRPMRLLVAEDNDINRLLAEALLRKLGHEPVMVVDGEKAVEAASNSHFDAILMDLHMPGLDGIGAIGKIRERESAEGMPPVPVIMVTADVMEDAREKTARAGAAGYLTKPLSADAIEDALHRLKKAQPLS